MKRFFIDFMAIVALFGSVSYAQVLTDMVQPGCFYRLSEKTANPADSLFRGADTSYRPTFYNGNRAICKGIWVARGCASGKIVVHPNFNTDSTQRYEIYVDSLDCGYPIGFIFDKIFKSGTTINLDSIGYFPNTGK